MASSSICTHFTQNAWKKDLCSNCFKSKDEHKPNGGNCNATSSLASRYLATLGGGNAANAKSMSNINANAALSTRTDANKKTDYPNKYKSPAKSIIKKSSAVVATQKTTAPHKSSGKSAKVTFPKNLAEVIGYGGEWSDNDSDGDDHDFMNLGDDERDEIMAAAADDEETIELNRITRANTDFNMNNGNLLGDPQDNIKRSFAALKLGAPQVDKEGKKQTLKINVQPFGATNSSSAAGAVASAAATPVKTKFEGKKQTTPAKLSTPSKPTPSVSMVKTTLLKKTTTSSSAAPASTSSAKSASASSSSSSSSSSFSKAMSVASKADSSSSSDSDGKNSPPIERAMEKSLLDEISETLEQKQNESKNLVSSKSEDNATGPTDRSSSSSSSSKIKFALCSLRGENEEGVKSGYLDLKKPIARNPPITKDQTKPKVNVFHKYSDTDSNCSDTENGVSAYYDVVESQISYENIPDGKFGSSETTVASSGEGQQQQRQQQQQEPGVSKSNSIYSSSQYITDMLLSSKTRAASYNLHEGNFMTSKITSDGLIVTKCSSDDALDSTGSSFDGSSDEEASYNMIRSESDSGIGISIGNDYKNISVEKQRERLRLEKKLSASTNNSDYEDIQVTDQKPLLPKPNANMKTTGGDKPQSQPQSQSQPQASRERELHGEPDGSADPDGSLEQKEPQQELPALPKSPPPTKLIDARPSFLHGMQKQHPPVVLKKPDVPAKPVVVSPPHTAPLKSFLSPGGKRQPTNVEQQVISQLQMVMSKSSENLNGGGSADSAASKDDAKLLRKGRAPNPPPEQKSSAPPTPECDYNVAVEFEEQTKREKALAAAAAVTAAPTATEAKHSHQQSQTASQQPSNPAKTKAESTATTEAIAVKSPETKSSPAASPSTPVAPNTIYTRKPMPASATVTANSSIVKNSAVSPVIREKDKRERATINPKFRSLNTFVMQRSNALKNQQLQTATSSLSLKQTMTPEPTPRNHHKNFSMSEECLPLAVTGIDTNPSDLYVNADGSDQKKFGALPALPAPPAKAKSKFSIKKFLRMGTGKSTENLQKKEGIYSEIFTGEEANVAGKPRLVIIHPIDINPAAVEVVKDITKTSDAVTAQTVAVVTSKPPAPPMRSNDGQRASHELNKPARPPPPKSAELRRKQMIDTTDAPTGVGAGAGVGAVAAALTGAGEAGGSIKCKADNVYANLGEIRSAIAPRKPERTASMREREAQLELARKRHVGSGGNGATRPDANSDTNSICSSNGDNVSAATATPTATATSKETSATNIALQHKFNGKAKASQSPQMSGQMKTTTAMTTVTVTDGKPPPPPSSMGINAVANGGRMKSDAKVTIASKLEIFENRSNNNNNSNTNGNASDSRPSSLKDSVRKITSTIDSYLKDKRDYENMYEFVKNSGGNGASPSSPPPPPARTCVDVGMGGPNQRLLPSRRVTVPTADSVSVVSYTRSEFGPARNYGLNNSLANIPRNISASYCGSESGDLDIYAPYSYYGSEAGGDVAADINDSVWGLPTTIKNRVKATNRLRMRKGRSVVHKSIEDNYTAVVVANHEALAQVLDQLQQTPIIPPALRPLANAINLRFEDFTILEAAQAFVVGKKAFHAALWTTAPVTLALSADCNQLSGVGGELNQLTGGVSGVLNPITEFCDLVPSYHLPLMPSTEVTLMQATISVLPRLQLDTLQSIGAILKGKSHVLDKSNFNFRGSIPNLNLAGAKDGGSSMSALRNVVSVQNLSTLNEESVAGKGDNGQLEGEGVAVSGGVSLSGGPPFDDVMTREVAFIMLQLVNGMKNLQGKAIEEMPLSLSNVVLSKDVENKDAQARLCVLQGNNNDEDEPMGTLCKCAHIALVEMLPPTKMTPILADILMQERAESLSKAKSVLEFVLWGPSDVVLSGSFKERELALQRWLDLERATVLHGLVRTRVELTVYDECHLMFLVRSTAKMMNDAATIVCNYQQQSARVADD